MKFWKITSAGGGQFLDDRGELLPRFAPAPMVASFMRDDSAAAPREHIPVPKGPVEVW